MNPKEAEGAERFNRDDPWQVRLKKMRDLVSDDVPSEIIHSNSVNPNFKVRKAWWAGVFAIFENAVDAGEVEPTLGTELTEFMEEFRQQGFFNQDRLATSEDIQRANAMINRVLGEEPRHV